MQLPETKDVIDWQRRFAMTANNRAWQLAALTERSEHEQREMLDTAHAAAVGGDRATHAVCYAAAEAALAAIADPEDRRIVDA